MDDLQAAVAQLREASRQAVRQLGFLDSRYRETGCTHSQCHILVELDIRRRVTVGELAGLLKQDISSTSRSIRSLIKQGFVKVHADSGDRRRRQLQLTAEGKSKAHEIHEVADNQARVALQLLNPADQVTVVHGMNLYAQALARSNKLSEVDIRPITSQDSEAMSILIHQVMSEFGAVGNGMSIGDAEVDGMYEAYLGPRSSFFVATRGHTLLGGAGIAPLSGSDDEGTCELRKMYVLPEGRGMGLGRKLMEHCLESAREMDYRRIYLETLENMCHARYLFEKFGFNYLEAPLGKTGHYGCTMWAVREL